MHLREFGYMDNFQIGSFRFAKLNVILYSIGEKEGILWNNRDGFSQIIKVERFDIFSINKHLSLLYIVHTGDKVENGRFARACTSYNSNTFSLRYMERNILQGSNLGIRIGEGYMLKANISYDRCRGEVCIFNIGSFM